MGFAESHAAAALNAPAGTSSARRIALFKRRRPGKRRGGGGGAVGAAAGGGAADVSTLSGRASLDASPCVDGPATYELFGVVSDMGGNTACGHYVAHVKSRGEWCIFNDERVARSREPPLDMGYLYFYRRAA